MYLGVGHWCRQGSTLHADPVLASQSTNVEDLVCHLDLSLKLVRVMNWYFKNSNAKEGPILGAGQETGIGEASVSSVGHEAESVMDSDV